MLPRSLKSWENSLGRVFIPSLWQTIRTNPLGCGWHCRWVGVWLRGPHLGAVLPDSDHACGRIWIKTPLVTLLLSYLNHQDWLCFFFFKAVVILFGWQWVSRLERVFIEHLPYGSSLINIRGEEKKKIKISLLLVYTKLFLWGRREARCWAEGRVQYAKDTFFALRNVTV